MSTLTLEKQGESIAFLGSESSAERVVCEIRMAPGAIGPPAHIHPLQKESYLILSGRITAKIEGRDVHAGPGETVVVDPGRTHTVANASASEPLVMRTVVEPALHFEWFLTEMARSAIRNGGSWKGVPFLEAAFLLHQMRGEYRLADLPEPAQAMVFGLLARLATLLGKTRRIEPKRGTVPVSEGDAPTA